MNPSPIITLTTDFGYKDPLVGIMKGVILGINPSVVVVDITHGVTQFNVREAALSIGMSYHLFPSRTIHVVVTDPGVGSERRPILAVAEHYYFVGPDNGVFSIIYNEVERCDVLHLTADHYFLGKRSVTFHGRDIFAPVAAWLSKGVSASNFGEMVEDYVRISFPVPSMKSQTALEGEVVHIDHFGNAITNIKVKNVVHLKNANPGGTVGIAAKGKQIPLKRYYGQAEDQGLCAVIDSMDCLELFVYKGNASKEFDIKIGEKVEVMLL